MIDQELVRTCHEEGEQQPEPPWTYSRVALHFKVTGDRLSVPVLARVIRLSIVRYCSVITTIAAAAAIEATIEVLDDSGVTSVPKHVITGCDIITRDNVDDPEHSKYIYQ